MVQNHGAGLLEDSPTRASAEPQGYFGPTSNEVRICDDVATLVPHPSDGAIDLATGGWPCQDLSGMGKRAGLTGARSGLFYHVLRVADAYGATWVFLENVLKQLADRSPDRFVELAHLPPPRGAVVARRAMEHLFEDAQELLARLRFGELVSFTVFRICSTVSRGRDSSTS